MEKDTARNFIQSNFLWHDYVAIVLIRKQSAHVEQRIASVARAISEQFQAWLQYKNEERYEIYISMNVLSATARGRKKTDIAQIRHVYLDFDNDGHSSIQILKNRGDLPTPNHIIQSSHGRFQCIWRVEHFTSGDAEALMRAMVRDLHADPAATDCSRVLRLPGFFNHNYGEPQLVTVENLNDCVYSPSHFPAFPELNILSSPNDRESIGPRRAHVAPIRKSQSERDWAYALRHLVRGEEPTQIARAIASHRPDKSNPEYYARHTVEKASMFLNRSGRGRKGQASNRRT